jgi:hypothetical protein
MYAAVTPHCSKGTEGILPATSIDEFVEAVQLHSDEEDSAPIIQYPNSANN